MFPDDRQLVEREVALPGLPALLDSQSNTRMLAMLGWQEASAVRCEYLRYKPRSSCLVGLRATLGDAEQYACAIAFGDEKNGKLTKLEETSTRNRVHIDHVRRLAVCKFPFDRRLPSLERLVDRDTNLVERLLPPTVLADSVEFSALRYKPERRFVTRIDHLGAPLGTIKLYSRAAYQHARRVAKTLGDSNRQGESRSLGHSDRHAAISFSWQPGEEATIGAWPMLAKRAGTEIAILHSLNTSKLPRLSQPHLLQKLHQAGDFAIWLAPETFALVRSVESAIASRLSDFTWDEVVLHGDLHLGQILVDKNCLTLIDFDRACLGPPEWDLANLAVDLHRCAGASLETLCSGYMLSEFLNSYEVTGRPIDLGLLATLTAVRIFEKSLEPFRCRQPKWQHELEQHIRAAGALLGNIRGMPRKPRQSVESVDERLPWLAAVCNRDEATRRFSTLPERFQVDRVQLLRHKPGRRALVEYQVTDGNTGAKLTLLGKTEHKPRHRRRLRIQECLWSAGFDASSPDGIAVARPVGVVPEWNMWLQEQVLGMNGWEALGSPRATEYASLTARTLAKLHRSNIKAPKTHTFINEQDLLTDRLCEAMRLAPRLAARIERLQRKCLALCDRQQDSEHVVLHRDFYPDQLLFTERGAVLLDLDLVCRGPASIDVGNFAGHLVEMGIRQHKNPDHFADVEDAFVEAYVDEARSDIRRLVNGCRVLALARHVFISQDREDRQNSTEDILTCCEELIAKE